MFADPDNAAAKEALADVYEHLGYGAENGTWRGFYLAGAQELRHGVTHMDLDLGNAPRQPPSPSSSSSTRSPSGSTACGRRVESLCIEWHFSDSNETLRTTLSNGVLIQTPNPRTVRNADLTLTLTKLQLLGLLGGQGLDGIEHIGDPGAIQRLLATLDSPDPAFAIVTP